MRTGDGRYGDSQPLRPGHSNAIGPDLSRMRSRHGAGIARELLPVLSRVRGMPRAASTPVRRLRRILQLRLGEMSPHPSPALLLCARGLTTMRDLLCAALRKNIAANALHISLVVGTVLNAIHQGGAIFDDPAVSWIHVFLNYLVPYCVATYSAARIQTSRDEESI